jgi:hypothetical protein
MSGSVESQLRVSLRPSHPALSTSAYAQCSDIIFPGRLFRDVPLADLPEGPRLPREGRNAAPQFREIEPDVHRFGTSQAAALHEPPEL